MQRSLQQKAGNGAGGQREVPGVASGAKMRGEVALSRIHYFQSQRECEGSGHRCWRE